MPVFQSGIGRAPGWCEVEYFDIVRPAEGAVHVFTAAGIRQRVFAVSGGCRLRFGADTAQIACGESAEFLSSKGCAAVEDAEPGTLLVRVCGRWGDQTGGCGVFSIDRSAEPRNTGDPTSYPRTTDFDNHYHDCDEYWLIAEGRCVAVSEDVCYVLKAGDCLATGRGHHHDLIDVLEPVRGVYFESTLEGARRTGHLWTHTHGAALPDPRRV